MTNSYIKLAEELDFVSRLHISEDYPCANASLAEAARILRAAASVDVAGLMELAAKAIYDQWADQLGWVEWVPGGNSLNQDEARSIARAALESALRMALAARAGWQPIETAPKDGTHIILSNGATVAEGWWEYQEPYIREKRDIDGRYIDQEESDGFDGWLDCQGGMQPDPTQWMPLPAAQPGAQEPKP